MNSGAPVVIYTGADDFSIAINDKNNSTIVSALNKTEFINSASVNYTSALTGGVQRTLSSKLSDVVSVKDFGAVGDGVTDDTASIQNALDTASRVFFPSGLYAVTSITIRDFTDLYGRPEFYGIATTTTKAVVNIVGRRCMIESLNVDQGFNTNYTAAIHWHSLAAGLPAQYNRIKALQLDNCYIGILFGQINGDTVVDAPQSENTITHMTTRGCQVPIYMNQSNGYLMVSASNLSSLKNEWPTLDYDETETAIVKTYQGVLLVSCSEVLKTDTQQGYGFLVSGGTIFLNNAVGEIASQNITMSAGAFYIDQCSFSMSNAAVGWATHTGGDLVISNSNVIRSEGAKSSNRGFIEWDDTSAIMCRISNVIVYNFLSSFLFRTDAVAQFDLPRSYFISELVSEQTDVSDGTYIPSDADARSALLGNSGVDLDCNSLDGWYYVLGFGGGSSYSAVADGPTNSTLYRTLSNSIQLVATGVAYVSTIDNTNLTTVKATGIRACEGQQFLVSAWIKETEPSGLLGVATSDAAGTVSWSALSTSTGSTAWEYKRLIYTVPAGVRYLGIALIGDTTTANITGARIVPLE